MPWTSTAQVTHVIPLAPKGLEEGSSSAAQHMSWEPCRRMCMNLEDIRKHGSPGFSIRMFKRVAGLTSRVNVKLV
jgi:hypothetical protein